MADAYYNGKGGGFQVGGTDVCVTNWRCTHTVEENEVTSTCSNGFYEVQGGTERLTGSFDANWKTDQSPFGLGLKGGSTVSNVKFFANKSGNVAITATTLFVSSVDLDMDVKGVVKYTANFTSNGAFTLPGTSTTAVAGTVPSFRTVNPAIPAAQASAADLPEASLPEAIEVK